MKKLFNYALLAAALLIGVNVNAVNVAKIGSQEYATIEEAFAAVQGTVAEPETITMLADANFGNCRIDLSGKYVIWDLAGKTVGTLPEATYSGFVMKGGHFEMVNTSASPATLNLKGNWKKEHGVYDNDHEGYVIMIYGSSEDVANYSTFIMDGDIRYTALGEDNYAIKVEGYPASENYKNAYGVTVDIKKGYVYGRYGALFVSGNIKATTGNRPVINVEKDAELEADDQCTTLGGDLSKGTGDITEAAKYYARKKWGDANLWGNDEAKNWAKAYKESSAAIYGGGVAEWTVNGYVHGGNGLYIKGGKVVLDGARVSATAAEYHEPILKSSGFLACGSAIILDSNEGYGELDGITISNSTVTSDNGYAIEEVVTAGTEKLPKIEVTSGTFVGGLGAITTTNEEKQEIIDRGDIGGGEWYNSDIDQYIDKNVNTTLDFVDGDGKHYQVVVPIKDSDWAQSIAVAATKGEGLKYAKVTANEEVNANTKVEFVRIQGDAVVTVKAGKTLDAGTLMTEGNSQVIVEAGGTLIISGAQGAYTYNENSIIVETSDETPGLLLINPAVVLNTTPKATVKFISKSYRNNADDKQFQYFGTPMVGQVESIKPDKDVQTSIELWNTADWEWKSLGILKADGTGLDMSKFNAPFGFYSMLANTPNTGDYKVTYTITGNLVGNTSPEIDLPDKWNAIANSYCGKIGTQALLDALKAENGLGKSVYTYEQRKTYLHWTAVNELRIDKLNLIPMAAFMLVNNVAEAKTIKLDYNNLVWTPATTPAKAPKVSQIAKATINVSNEVISDVITIAEDAMFTADFEDGYDAEKFDNQFIKFYVNADGEYDIYATDNLNNTFVGLMTTEAGKYTISFEDVTGNFDLVDNKTNARIAMAEGTTYEFLAEAGEDAYRFMIVEAAKAPTNTPATKAAMKATKALINDQIVISNGERFFNMLGTDVK